MNSTRLNVLLDSTYILPTFGIEVEGLSNKHLTMLRDAALNGKVEYYCSTVIWIEVIGKVSREGIRIGINLDDILDIALKSLFKSGFYRWIQPNDEALKIAFKLRLEGHKDNIDNLLYATSITNNMVFLTMDEDLKEFLLKQGYKIDNLMNHIRLLEILKVG